MAEQNTAALNEYIKHVNAKDFTKALKHLLLAAEQNDSNAQAILGYCYLHGILVEKDSDWAFFWLNESAQQYNPFGTVEIAMLRVFSMDCKEGGMRTLFKLYEEDPDLETDEYYRGLLFMTGGWEDMDREDPQDTDEISALKCFASLSEDHPNRGDAWYWMGKIILNSTTVDTFQNLTVEKCYKKAARKGHAPAMLKLGKWYSSKEEVMVFYNPYKSLHYYKLAAAQGSIKASTMVVASEAAEKSAISFFAIKFNKKISLSQHVNVFVSTAPKELFSMIARDVANSWSLCNVYSLIWNKRAIHAVHKTEKIAPYFEKYKHFYKAGRYVEALKCLRFAAENAHTESMCELAIHCKYGTLNLLADERKYKYWMIRSFICGSEKALFYIHLEAPNIFGEDFLTTITQFDDHYYDEWFNMFEHSINCTTDNYLLGKLYDSGTYLPIDGKKSFTYLMNGAKEGSPYQHDCEYEVGLCYERGRGVTQDFGEAFRWHSKAAESGHVFSMYSLMHLYESGNYEQTPKQYMAEYWKGRVLQQCTNKNGILDILKKEREYDIKQKRI